MSMVIPLLVGSVLFVAAVTCFLTLARWNKKEADEIIQAQLDMAVEDEQEEMEDLANATAQVHTTFQTSTTTPSHQAHYSSMVGVLTPETDMSPGMPPLPVSSQLSGNHLSHPNAFLSTHRKPSTKSASYSSVDRIEVTCQPSPPTSPSYRHKRRTSGRGEKGYISRPQSPYRQFDDEGREDDGAPSRTFNTLSNTNPSLPAFVYTTSPLLSDSADYLERSHSPRSRKQSPAFSQADHDGYGSSISFMRRGSEDLRMDSNNELLRSPRPRRNPFAREEESSFLHDDALQVSRVRSGDQASDSGVPLGRRSSEPNPRRPRALGKAKTRKVAKSREASPARGPAWSAYLSHTDDFYTAFKS